MLLNMLRLEFAEPEYMLLKSFHQFQNEQAIPGLRSKISELEAEHGGIVIQDEEDVAAYFHLRNQLAKVVAPRLMELML